jgi:hypothetical protein
LIAGGFTTNSQWPVRGEKPYAIQRIDWSGETPFEIQEIKIQPDGFDIAFTQPVDATIASDPDTYNITTYTHIYAAFYGSPEVDHTLAQVSHATVSGDQRHVRVQLDRIQPGHIHDFDLAAIRSQTGEPLLHANAYYTVNQIPGQPPVKP